MAKKSSSKAEASKAKKPAKAAKKINDHALALAVLKRAKSVIESAAKKENGGEIPQLPAGTYPLDVAMRVSGDIIVAEATETAPKESPSFTDDQLAAVIFEHDPDWVNYAVGVLRKISDAQLKSYVAKYRDARDAAAIKAGLWEKPESEDKAGAVTGKPSVRLDGTTGTRKVQIEFAKP